MFLLCLRTLLIYALIIGAMRLMGKKQLGELQPSELVSTILLSNLASISIESPELPLFSSLVPVFIIVAMEILVSALCVRSRKAAHLISGAPCMIIRDGVIDQKALLELRFSVDDLLEALHGKDIFELNEVAFALVETNGSISVKKKFPYDTPCNQDMGIPPPKATQPSLPVVIDGTLCPANMRYLGLDEAWVQRQCRQQSCTLQQVLLLLCNDAQETTLIKKDP
jgi:uncharacterized membrane protein YcaP (DUF421 family)